jgi:hypothetical protein
MAQIFVTKLFTKHGSFCIVDQNINKKAIRFLADGFILNRDIF